MAAMAICSSVLGHLMDYRHKWLVQDAGLSGLRFFQCSHP